MGSGYRANGVLANYVYLYGSLLLIVYTGKMAVTLACKYFVRNSKLNRKIRLSNLMINDIFQSPWK